MSRPILVFGQSGAGKSYSIKTLPPDKTVVIDADKKSFLPFAGSKKFYGADKKNFYSTNSLDAITTVIKKIGNEEKFSDKIYLVIDGISKALTVYEATYNRRNNPKNNFEAYKMLKEKAVDLFDVAKSQRDNLNVIFIGNVKVADPFQATDVDRLKVPGNFLKDYEIESDFNYVFYAKVVDRHHFFETYPNRSTAKTPEGSFPPEIDNDLFYITKKIDAYESGEESEDV